MTTERTIIAILVAFIIGVMFTATPVGGAVVDPVKGVLRISSAGSPAPVELVNFQGLITDPGTGEPIADNIYSVRFSVWDAAAAGTEKWNETQNVTTSDGLFSVLLGSVTPITATVFEGSPRYLEVKVGADPAMTPRQQFATVAYAFHAVNAWSLGGNSGTTAGTDIVGTTDNQALELQVNSNRALRLEPNATSPNVLGGYSGNSVTSGAFGAAIGGGGSVGVGNANSVTDDYSTVGGGVGNQAGDNAGITEELYATVAGGNHNAASGHSSSVGGGGINIASASGSTVGGGNSNNATADRATVGGGISNTASGADSTVGGGDLNTASASWSTVGGGFENTASGLGVATVGGGAENTASGLGATIGGGRNNTANKVDTTVGGGYGNTASGIEATVGGGDDNTASGDLSAIGGGYSNAASATLATIGGGGRSDPGNAATANTVTDDYGTVGGGGNNQAGDATGATTTATYATVGGGEANRASGSQSTVGGGLINWASGSQSTVGGGANNTADGNYSTISGGEVNGTSGLYSFVGGGSANDSIGDFSTVGGGYTNQATGDYATIAGGGRSDGGIPSSANRVTDNYGTVGGGGDNQAGDGTASTINAPYATVGGGRNNDATLSYATIGGGRSNDVDGEYGTIGGGGESVPGSAATANRVTDNYGTVGGGGNNQAGDGGVATDRRYATVGGGQSNTASGQQSTVPGGFDNTASGAFSFAAGRSASATHAGSFVWADDTAATIASTAVDQFTVRASGGTRIFSNSTSTVGVNLPAGGNAWAVISDRNVKANFAEVDGRDVLDQLASIPIDTWNLTSQDESIRHIGPVAQDFYAAFEVGEDNTHITTSDADGVALASIQALYDLVQEQEAQIAALKGEGVAPAEAAGADPAATGSDGPDGLFYGLLLALVLALPASAVAIVLGRKALLQARS